MTISRRLLASPVFWPCWGLVMVIMGTRLPWWSWPPSAGRIAALVILAPLAALLAPPQLRRPMVLSSRRLHRLDLYRNTLFSAGFVLLLATVRLTAVEAGVDAFLLAGYLVMLDAATMPATVLRRTASPVFLLALAATAAGSTAMLALPAQSSWPPRIAAVVMAAIGVGVAVGTAFTAAYSRRVSSQVPEAAESDHSR